jgi:hypothetical protein
VAFSTLVSSAAKRLAVWLAAFQLLDAIAAALPRRYVKAHLDHLGVPDAVRPLLPAIKVAASAGLLVGLKQPRVGAVTAAGLVAFYAAAVQFHLLADDHPLMTVPAVVCGAAAGVALVGFELE